MRFSEMIQKEIEERRRKPSIKEIQERRQRLINIYRPEKGERDYVFSPPEIPPPQSAKAPAYLGNAVSVPLQAEKIKESEADKNKSGESKEHKGIEETINQLISPVENEQHPETPAKTIMECKGLEEKKEIPFSGTLYDIVRYFHTPHITKSGQVSELVGGEDGAVITALCYASDVSFGVEGNSGSGKTLLMDRWRDLLDPEQLLIVSQMTPAALHHMADEFNKKSWAYFSEIQKITVGNMSKKIPEILKDLAEGRPSTLHITMGKKETETITLQPVNICFTRAYQQEYDLDAELRRRFVVINTDSGIEHTQKVNEKTLENWTRIETDDMKRDHINSRLRKHLSQLAARKNLRYIDPFNLAFGEIIKDIPNSNCFLPQYGSLLQACAKYHLNDRMVFEHDGIPFVALNLEDHYHIRQAYYGHFLKALGKWNQMELEPKPVEWEVYFQRGIERMRSDPNLEILRKEQPEFIDQWIESQLSSGEVKAVDYKTGARIAIAGYTL